MILKSWFCTLSEGLYVNVNYADLVVIQKKIFKDFSIETHIVSKLWSLPTPGEFLINLILNSVGKLSCKFKLFWIIGSWEQYFSMTWPPYICMFVIISPLMSVCPFISTNLNSLYARIICINFDWNWLSGFGEKYSNISLCDSIWRQGPWC
jgi:hypothetical protein